MLYRNYNTSLGSMLGFMMLYIVFLASWIFSDSSFSSYSSYPTVVPWLNSISLSHSVHSSHMASKDSIFLFVSSNLCW